MNLNNKNLAIGLSVAAVLIVSYQIFFNKPEPKRLRRPRAQKPAAAQPTQGNNAAQPPIGTNAAQPPAQQLPSTDMDTAYSQPDTGRPPVTGFDGDTDTMVDSGGGGPVIDFNSPILLKRILPDMAIDRPKMELSQEFGIGIFSGNESAAEEKKEPGIKKESVRIVQFTLNAIVIDETRRLTIINNTILKVGEMIQGAQVDNIVKGKVVLKVNKKTVVLSTNSRVKQVRLLEEQGE